MGGRRRRGSGQRLSVFTRMTSGRQPGRGRFWVTVAAIAVIAALLGSLALLPGS